MFAGLETKLIGAGLLVVALLSVVFYIHHLNNTIKTQTSLVEQLTIIDKQKDDAIVQLQQNMAAVQKRVEEANTERNNTQIAVDTQEASVKTKTKQVKQAYKQTKTEQQKQAFINDDLQRRFWCAGQLTVADSKRDPAYVSRCLPVTTADKNKK